MTLSATAAAAAAVAADAAADDDANAMRLGVAAALHFLARLGGSIAASCS